LIETTPSLSGCVAAAALALAGCGTANAAELQAITGTSIHGVCEFVRDALRKASPEALAGASIEWSVESNADLPAELGGAHEAEFDFDNDGVNDGVFLRSFEDHYMMGSALLVQPGRTSAASSDDQPGDDPNAVFIPCQWNASAIAMASCPPFSQENDEAGFAIPRGKPRTSVFFRARYSALYPFRLNERTYVAMTSASADTTDFTAVVEPAPHARFKPRCLLHRGRIEKAW